MNKEILRMQMLAGIITESEYKQKLNKPNNQTFQYNISESELKSKINEISIQQLQQQFVDSGKLSQSIFDDIKNTTPKGAYATWLVTKVINKDIPTSSIDSYKTNFQIFDKYKSKFPSPDINAYGKQFTIDEFENKVEEILKEIDLDPSKTKGVSKNEKYSKLQIGNINGFNVYKIPKGAKQLKQVSCELGSGTSWCTAHSESTNFEDYIKNGPLYIFDKGDGEKYQIQIESHQFMDKNDTSDWVKTNNKLFSSFINFLTQKENIKVDFLLKLIAFPDKITKDDLYYKGDIDLVGIDFKGEILPDGLYIEGDLFGTDSNIKSLPDGITAYNVFMDGSSMEIFPKNLTLNDPKGTNRLSLGDGNPLGDYLYEEFSEEFTDGIWKRSESSPNSPLKKYIDSQGGNTINRLEV